VAGSAGHGADVMKSGNTNGYIGFEKTQLTRIEWMASYDALPPEQRKMLQDAPYNLNLKQGMSSFWFGEVIRRTKNESILKTWGSDHPEYRKDA
jgi:hypothetical protein